MENTFNKEHTMLTEQEERELFWRLFAEMNPPKPVNFDKSIAKDSRGSNERVSTSGFIYLMNVPRNKRHNNYALDGYYKIGYTLNPVQRLRDINDPLPFDMIHYDSIYFQKKTADKIKVAEKNLHIKFSKYKIIDKNRKYGGPEWREWFFLPQHELEKFHSYAAELGFDKCKPGCNYHTEKVIYVHK